MALDLRLELTARRRGPLAGLGLLALAALVLAWQGWQARSEAQALEHRREHVASLQRGSARAAAAAAPGPAELARRRDVEALALYLATPWGPLLEVLEANAGAGVVLLRFAPDAATGRVEVGGRAQSLPALSRYMLALEEDGRLRDVLPRRHEAVRDAAPGAVDFTLTASWGQAPGAVPAAAQPMAAAAPPVETRP